MIMMEIKIIARAISAFSCSPFFAGIHVGEIRTTNETNILQARIDENPIIPGFPSPGGGLTNNSALATINLATGRLSPGPPNATLVPKPQGNSNTTAGYIVEIGSANVSLIDSGGSPAASFDWSAYIDDYAFRGIYFVSKKLQRGYIFFEARASGCTSPDHEVAVAIIDLSSSTISDNMILFTTTVFESWPPFDIPPPDGFCNVLVGDGVETIYDDDTQVVALPGNENRCVEKAYVFFNETSVHFTNQKDMFESWDMLDAILYGENANENKAFLVHHEYNWYDTYCYEYLFCPESYSIQEIVISTGEILRTIDLNRQDIVSILYDNYTSTTPTLEPSPEPSPEPTPEPTAHAPTPDPTPDASSGTIVSFPHCSFFLMGPFLFSIA